MTLDHHVDAAFASVRRRLERRVPGLRVSLHVAADWEGDADALGACRRDLADADIVVVTQLFLHEHVAAIADELDAHRAGYRALAVLLSDGELVKRTRLGRVDFSKGEERGRFSPLRLLKKLRGSRTDGVQSGRRQMKMLRRLPALLRWVPGPAQDVRAYLMTLRYWLAASEENLEGMVLHLLARYAPEGTTHGDVDAPSGPVEYPETGLYHPALPNRVGETLDELRGARASAGNAREATAAKGERQGRVGLLLMRSHVLAGNAAHYDALVGALEARGLEPVPAFAAGLDARPAIERFFLDDAGRPTVDALVSLTGFPLIGGPAYSDADATRALLRKMDLPYLVLQPLEFQTIEAWDADPRGLNPVQSALMVSLPEIEGATGPLVFGGASVEGPAAPVPDRIERAAERVRRWIELRRTPRAERKVGVVLFNFPPNGGAVGTAAYLDVFASLHRTLRELGAAGYDVEVPATVDALRERLLGGNAERSGTPANVHARIPVDDHVRREPHLDEIEAVWGPAPGRDLASGSELLVLGERFGNVFVGVQPPFGWEGDPMRLLFQGGFAPTHAFSAFYRWVREDVGAHALLHFGTHGALEFMPGKQIGVGARCWPDRLVGDTPNVYLYAANNPSEGTLAKRRAAATTVTYLTPPVTRAGLYRGLLDLERTVDGWRRLEPDARAAASDEWVERIRLEAEAVDLIPADAPPWEDPEAEIESLRHRLHELEESLVPAGLHVVGEAVTGDERAELLVAAAHAAPGRDHGSSAVEDLFPAGSPGDEDALSRILVDATERIEAHDPDGAVRALESVGGDADAARHLVGHLDGLRAELGCNREIEGLLHALDGAYVEPVPGGDLLRNPDILPTGRNLYAFDPYGVPSPAAVRAGRAQAERLLERHLDAAGALPDAVALVLWGTDNMKRDAAPVAQALALIGAEPVFDNYGRLAGARLLSLEELGRPRVDVVVTTSGVFRDLLPLQLRLLAEAAWLAASADEPLDLNPVRRHALAEVKRRGCSLEEAALRVFSNADGAYGGNVNQTVEQSSWDEAEELGETFVRRKGFAYGPDGREREAHDHLREALSRVDLAYQNLDSVELGIMDVDQYVDSLGGVLRAARTERAAARSGSDGNGATDATVAAYVGDETRGRGRVRTLDEQVALETRTRVLNPRWYEPLLEHGYQGVHEIETRATTALGWSATGDSVEPWVYQRMSETFVLDDEMRRRLAELNPAAATRMTGRLVEATERGFWSPDDETLDALHRAHEELEDAMEGIGPEVAA